MSNGPKSGIDYLPPVQTFRHELDAYDRLNNQTVLPTSTTVFARIKLKKLQQMLELARSVVEEKTRLIDAISQQDQVKLRRERTMNLLLDSGEIHAADATIRRMARMEAEDKERDMQSNIQIRQLERERRLAEEIDNHKAWEKNRRQQALPQPQAAAPQPQQPKSQTDKEAEADLRHETEKLIASLMGGRDKSQLSPDERRFLADLEAFAQSVK